MTVGRWPSPRTPGTARLALAVVESIVLVGSLSGSWFLYSGRLALPDSWLAGTPFASWGVPAVLLLLAVALPAGLAAVLEVTDHAAAPTASLVHGLGLIVFIAVQLVLLERYLVFQPLALAAAVAVLAVCAHRGPGTGTR